MATELRTIYGLGGHNPELPNNNVISVEEVTVPDPSPEEIVVFNARDAAQAFLDNPSPTQAQAVAALKALIQFALNRFG
jgi:hypothetical protein